MKIDFDNVSVCAASIEQLEKTIETYREMPAMAAIPGLVSFCGSMLRELRVNERLHINLFSQSQLMFDIGYDGVPTGAMWWRVCVLSYNSEHVVPIEDEVSLELKTPSIEVLERLPKEGGVCFAITDGNAGVLADYASELLSQLATKRAAA